MSSEDLDKKIVSYSLVLITFENGVGSILHSFKIPFAGQIMSINQIGILSRVTAKTSEKNVALKISLNASLLKSLSPSGKKLTPMLAILVQGFLFQLPFYFIGINLVSFFVGIFLSSIWAFLQSILSLYIMFGEDIFKIIIKLIKDAEGFIPNIEEKAKIILLSIIVLKVLCAFFYSYFLIKIDDNKFLSFEKKIENIKFKSEKKERSNLILSALKELFNPIFVFSLALSIIYFFVIKADTVTIIWGILRPVAIGFMLFYFFKITPDKYLFKILKFFRLEGHIKYLKEIRNSRTK